MEKSHLKIIAALKKPFWTEQVQRVLRETFDYCYIADPDDDSSKKKESLDQFAAAEIAQNQGMSRETFDNIHASALLIASLVLKSQVQLFKQIGKAIEQKAAYKPNMSDLLANFRNHLTGYFPHLTFETTEYFVRALRVQVDQIMEKINQQSDESAG